MSAHNTAKEWNDALIKKVVPIPLGSVRELTSGSIPNDAADDGIIGSDGTPSLNALSGDTDGAWRIRWVASDSTEMGFQVAIPDIVTDRDLTIHFRANMDGATDTPTVASDVYFNEADTKVEDASAAVTGTTYAEYSITVAAADIPDGAQTISCALTPGAHTTDKLTLTAIWLEYAQKVESYIY